MQSEAENALTEKNKYEIIAALIGRDYISERQTLRRAERYIRAD